ncbi:MAG TPA: hypothetical protein VFW17_14195 [Ktedonobacterales bacterium]|nr:hypothetical protein [Ktedonobacterales bacterium]
MRWFWQRRRQRQSTVAAPSPTPTRVDIVQRAPTTSGRIGQPRQLTGDLLMLARDYLQSIGGRVRVEDDDVLSATLPDGSLIRYTTSLAKARSDETMTLLVEGSDALAAMLDDIAARSRLTALRLTPAADPVALAIEQGRMALHWRTSGPLSARVVRQEESVAVELAYLVVARDRQGRQDVWMREAIDIASGQPVTVLSDMALASAQPDSVPSDYAPRLAHSRACAERILHDSLAATGIFLRQRSLNEYRRRLEEVATTFDRLQRESQEIARAAKVGRKRELSALSEVYAVDVEAQLESACFITSSLAQVALHPSKGHAELLVGVDLGRQQVFLPDCCVCGRNMQTGYVCDAGHALCAECAMACKHCGAWGCAACGEPEQVTCAKCGLTVDRLAASQKAALALAANDILTVRHLEALPQDIWLMAMDWLLSNQGITVESRRSVGALGVWQGESATGKLVAAAVRPTDKALDEAALRQAAAHLAPEQRSISRMVFSTAPATEQAAQAAEQLGVRILDRFALESLLASLASAHERERERQLDDMQARAEAANATRKAMLDAVDAVDHRLASLRRSRRSSSRPANAGTAASRALTEVRTAIERASLAWETLLTDWAESFGDHAARNGALVMQGEVSHFAEMGERAEHLQTALLDATALLVETAAHGEAGYMAWRQAVVEECSARCESWRWRIRTFEPAAWGDFDRAWNAKAAAKAAEATTAAGHATARADKAQAQALRAG